MSGKSETDPTVALFVVVAFVGIVVWVVWSMFEPELMNILRYIRVAEYTVLGIFTNHGSACLHWLKAANTGTGAPTNEAWTAALSCFGADNLRRLQPAEALAYANISPESMGVIGIQIGDYMRPPVVVICAFFAYVSLFKSKARKFRTHFTLETFIQIQAKVWPVIAPIVSFVPSKLSARMVGDKMPDKIPPMAEAFAPEEWISFYRIPVVNGIPDRESTRRAFQAQLGPRWRGYDNLPPYLLALIAAFALKGCQKRDECDEMLGKISLGWSEKDGFQISPELLAEVKKIIADPAFGGKASEIADAFAYRTTAMLGLLKWARFMGGVLAPAQFIWLRAVDRNLWYPMNNLGRRSFHTEGAGAMAHFMAELAAQKPLIIPRVETAIVTLNQYMGRAPIKIPPRDEPKTIEQKRKG